MTRRCPLCGEVAGTWIGAFAIWTHCLAYPDCRWVERVERERTDTRQLPLLGAA